VDQALSPSAVACLTLSAASCLISIPPAGGCPIDTPPPFLFPNRCAPPLNSWPSPGGPQQIERSSVDRISGLLLYLRVSEAVDKKSSEAYRIPKEAFSTMPIDLKRLALYSASAAALGVTGWTLSNLTTVAATGQCCQTSLDCPGTQTCWLPVYGQIACSGVKPNYCS